jgi:hypothetical protein
MVMSVGWLYQTTAKNSGYEATLRTGTVNGHGEYMGEKESSYPEVNAIGCG